MLDEFISSLLPKLGLVSVNLIWICSQKTEYAVFKSVLIFLCQPKEIFRGSVLLI